MRKLYISILACLLAFATGLQAQERYDAIGFGDGGALPEIEEGVQVGLQVASATTETFLNITDRGFVTLKSTIDEFGVFEFVAADEEDCWYLKSTKVGLYLEDPVYSSNVIRLTDSKLRAAKLHAAHPYVFSSADELNEARENESEVYSNYTYTLDNISGNEEISWKFVTVNSQGSYAFASNYYNQTNWSNPNAYNTWMLYPLEKKDAYETLTEVFTDLLPEGEETLKVYVAGDDPGQVDEELVDDLYQAYEVALELINSGSSDMDACQEALEHLVSAWNTCADNVKPMRGGYFYFSSWRTESAGGTAIPDNGVYENESDHLTYWSFTNGWTRPDVPTIEDAKYIYRIIDNGDGTFYLQNFWTKRYLGYVSGNNKKIPTTETPEEKYKISIHPNQPGMFSVTSTTREASSGDDGKWPCMHAAGDYNAIVFWSADAAASAWYFNEIPEEEIEAFEEEMEQTKLNDELASLVETATSAYKKGFAYTSEGTADSDYSIVGLVSDVNQLFTNAQEDSEGPIENAVDNDLTSFFHSAWKAESYNKIPDGIVYHNICADLGQAVEAVMVKLSKRINTGNESSYASDAPGLVHFYATNDTTGFSKGDYSKWVDQGTVEFKYPYAYEVDEENTLNNKTGLNACAFDGAYRFVRIDVIKRLGSADVATLAANQRFFNLSEIRFYEAEYDPDNSLIEVVDKDVIDGLLEALEVANDELYDESATKGTIANLQEAYQKFLDNYPDPQQIKDLIAEAKAQAEAAEEGTALGYFQTGAKAELNTVLTKVEGEISDVMSLAEINAAKAEINAALAAFNAKLIKPVDGAYYFIQSATSGAAADNYLFAQNYGTSAIKWGGKDDDDHLLRLNGIWKTYANEDGSYTLQNMATGTYLGVSTTVSTQVPMTNEETVSVTLRSAKVAGLFNIVLGENAYANADPNTKLIVVWNSASGTDNSAFKFVPAEWDAAYVYDVNKTVPTPVTLPFGIIAPDEIDGAAYKVLGYKVVAAARGLKADENAYKLVLEKYGVGEIIPAATPFIVQMEDGVTSLMLTLVDASGNEVSSLDDIVYDFNVKTQNGLVGVLEAQEVSANCGILVDGKILFSEDGDSVPANSAFLTMIPETDAEGDLEIDMEGAPTSIASVSTALPVNGKVYDLTGRRVVKMQKGLYIINGKKVIK